jgi:AraC-like DNA-binding protein
MRVIFIGVIAAYTVAMSSTAMISGHDAEAVLASTANAWGLAILSAIFTWHMMRALNNELFAVVVPDPNLASARNIAINATEDKTNVDPTLLASLEQLMSVDRVYREENLTVGALAQKLSIPEHALRKLINQHLGHRNFTAFLNGYRLREAKAALLDPEKAHLPILTIALSTGFQSIGPFNRAFKAETGVTPTDFRRMTAESLGRENT